MQKNHLFLVGCLVMMSLPSFVSAFTSYEGVATNIRRQFAEKLEGEVAHFKISDEMCAFELRIIKPAKELGVGGITDFQPNYTDESVLILAPVIILVEKISLNSPWETQVKLVRPDTGKVVYQGDLAGLLKNKMSKDDANAAAKAFQNPPKPRSQSQASNSKMTQGSQQKAPEYDQSFIEFLLKVVLRRGLGPRKRDGEG